MAGLNESVEAHAVVQDEEGFTFCRNLVNSSTPLSNECFVDGLRHIPNAFLCLTSITILIAWKKSQSEGGSAAAWVHFPWHTIRWILTLCLLFLNILQLSEGIISDSLHRGTRLRIFMPHVLGLCGSLLSIIYYHNTESVNSPRFLLLLIPYWAASLAVEVVKIINMNIKGISYIYLRPHLSWAGIVIYSFMLLIELDVLRVLKYAFFKKRRQVTPPEDLERIAYQHSYVSFFSKGTFLWILNILTIGYKRPLEIQDLGLIPKEESSACNYTKLNIAYEKERRRLHHSKRLPSLWRVYWRAFWPWMMVAAALRLLGDLLTFVGPILIGGIIIYVERKVEANKNTNVTELPLEEQYVTVTEFFTNGYILALLLFLASLLINSCLQGQHFLALREGVRLRSAIQMLVYKKTLSLKLKSSDPRRMLTSSIADHMTVDPNNLFFYMYTINLLWALPLKVIIALILLYYFLGKSILVAAGIIIILSAVQLKLSHVLSNLKHTYLEYGEERLTQCNNLFSAIKLVKVYAWEPWFARDISVARRKQAGVMAKIACIKAVSMFITEGTPVIVTLVAFVLYPYLESEPLTPARAFTSLALCDSLGLPLLLFPILVNFMSNARRSTSRLEKFFAEPEIKHNRLLYPWAGSGLKNCKVKFEMEEGLPMVSIVETSATPRLDTSPGAEPPNGVLSDHLTSYLAGQMTRSHERMMGFQDEPELHVITEAEEETHSKSESDYLLPNKTEEGPDIVSSSRESSGEGELELGGDKERRRRRSSGGGFLDRSQFREYYSRQICSSISTAPGSMADDESVDLNRDVGVAVSITSGTFAWGDDESEEPQLIDINFEALAGSLTMLVGKDHSGKSSLIAALLGEMTQIAGTVNWKSGVSVAYVAEIPWLLNTTLQENILFGRSYEKKRYRRVINCCALQPDIDILPNGDMTLIGEQGMGLSRGQRQRVSLARAMYSSADVVLLDQPFTSQDLRMSAHVFEQGVLRWMIKRRRTIILVTHQLQYLAFADMVYRLKDGKITHQGTLQEIKVADPELFSVWREKVKEERKEVTQPADYCKTKSDRSKLRRKIKTMEFQRELTTPVFADPEERGDSSQTKQALINQQLGQMSFYSDNQAGVEQKPVSSQPTADADLELGSDIPENIAEVDEEIVSHNKPSTFSSLISNKEEGVHGVMNCDLLWLYVQACSVGLTVGVLVLHVLRTSLAVSADYWLAQWTNSEYQAMLLNQTTSTEDSDHYFSGFVILASVAVVFTILVVIAAEFTGVRAAKYLHCAMLENVIYSPMKFFDITPISQILNRFSADISTVDDKLPTTMEHFLRTSLMCVAALIINCLATAWFVLVVIPVAISYYIIQKFFRSSAREFLKLDNVSKPPIMAHFTETVMGLPVIRAYRDEQRFVQVMHKHIDTNSLAFLWMHTANRWMGLRMEYLASIVMFSSALATITVGCSGVITPGTVGLAITYTLLMLSYSNFLVRSGADAELQLHAVERIRNIATLAADDDIHGDIVGDEAELPEDWPTQGEVRFSGVSLKYDTAPTPILRDINFHLAPGQRLGVCGTDYGGGKSSLALGLWRIVETSSGHIYIDGTDIRRVPLGVLRSSLTLVPQDPTLLSGSVRYNLDPSGQCSDKSLWHALEKAGAKDLVLKFPRQLDETIHKLSIGKKQLLCIARALLRQSKILVLDQIVSFVDSETEEIIRKVVENRLKNLTLIHIAHNPSWLLNYDSVLVLRRGYVIEYGAPQILMEKEESIFRLLVEKALKELGKTNVKQNK